MDVCIQIVFVLFLLLLPKYRSEISTKTNVSDDLSSQNVGFIRSKVWQILQEHTTNRVLMATSAGQSNTPNNSNFTWSADNVSETEHQPQTTARNSGTSHASANISALYPALLTCHSESLTNNPPEEVLLGGFCPQRRTCQSTKAAVNETTKRQYRPEQICDNFGGMFTEELCANLECFPCTCQSCDPGTCCSEDLAEAEKDSGQYIGCLTEPENAVHAIVRCPDDWPSESEVRWKCEHGTGRTTKDEPVSGLSRDVIFRNQHCALCHGVRHYRTWERSVQCRHFQYVYTAETEEELLDKALEYSNTCWLRHEPPDNVHTQGCSSELKWYNISQMVTSCNATGLWERYDNILVQHCAQYKALTFRVTDKITGNLYRNAYCAACNGVHLTYSKSHCDRLDEAEELAAPPLTLLLGLHPHQEGKPEPVVPGNCPKGTWRNLEDVCENARCMKGKIFSEHDGHCNTAITMIRGLAYDLDITLLPREHLFAANNAETWHLFQLNFAQLLKAKVLDEVEFYVVECFPTFITVNEEVHRVQQIRVKGWVMSKRNSSRDVVERSWVDNLLSDWNLTVAENKTLTFRFTHSVFAFNEPWAENIPTAFSFKLNSSDAWMEKDRFPFHLSIPLTPLLTCPYIEFRPHQFEVRLASNASVEIVLKSESSRVPVPVNAEVHLRDQTLFVCLNVLEKLPRDLRYRLDVWSSSYSLYLMSMIVIPLSAACLCFILLVYAELPTLRTQPGLNMMGTCCSLLLAQVSLLLAAHRPWTGTRCVVLGVVVHASWLGTFCWTCLSSLHMFRTFSSLSVPAGSRTSLKPTIKNALLANLVFPGGVVVGVVAGSYISSGGQSIGYSPVTCYLDSPWLVGFSVIAPLSVTILPNACFFIRTVWRIRQAIKLRDEVGNETKSSHHYMKVCLRLSLLTGATWVLSLLAENLDVDWLRAFSILTNGGQGVLLLLSYVMTRRVADMLVVELGCRAGNEADKAQVTLSCVQELCTWPTESEVSVENETSNQ